MKKTRKILNILLSISMAAALSYPAFALEYSFDEAPGMAYGPARGAGRWRHCS